MALLIAQAAPDMPAADVLRAVHGVREKAWPNLRLVELGDAALHRGGTLVAATHALHRLQLDVRPHLAEFMTGAGRKRTDASTRAMLRPMCSNASLQGRTAKRSSSGNGACPGRDTIDAQRRAVGSGIAGTRQANRARSLPRR